MDAKNRLVWVDLEMTGLNAQKDLILECALLITDNALNPVAPGINYVIQHDSSALNEMTSVVRQMHTQSGLLESVIHSSYTLAAVEEEMLALLRKHCVPKAAPLCGNSVWVDAAFLHAYMPRFMDFLHYRIVDVSSLKELVKRWYPDTPDASFVKKNMHRALSDIEESIAELHWYRKHFFKTDNTVFDGKG